MNNNKFLKFEHTSVYQQFGTILTVEPELVLVSEYEYYTDTLTYLRSIFNCDYTPTQIQIDTYINDNNENIDTDCIDEFNVLIHRIFDKYGTINRLLKKMHIKHILKERIINERETRALEKKRIKDEYNKLVAAEKERKYIEKQKIKEEKQKHIYDHNNTIIRCMCGIEYIRYLKINHEKSTEHRYRLDGINWYKNNSSFVFDTNSIISESDISSIDSSNFDI
jgi:hypothetical protein